MGIKKSYEEQKRMNGILNVIRHAEKHLTLIDISERLNNKYVLTDLEERLDKMIIAGNIIIKWENHKKYYLPLFSFY